MPTKVSFKNEDKIRYILKLSHDPVKEINQKTMHTQKEFLQSVVFYTLARELTSQHV